MTDILNDTLSSRPISKEAESPSPFQLTQELVIPKFRRDNIPKLTRNCSGCLKNAYQGNSLRACGRCKRTSYCSIECQKHDWPIHKQFCGKTADKRLATLVKHFMENNELMQHLQMARILSLNLVSDPKPDIPISAAVNYTVSPSHVNNVSLLSKSNAVTQKIEGMLQINDLDTIHLEDTAAEGWGAQKEYIASMRHAQGKCRLPGVRLNFIYNNDCPTSVTSTIVLREEAFVLVARDRLSVPRASPRWMIDKLIR
ncbi:hypothetical protein M422DRAFT_261844 [Sphaerobolus stellatus SS14]|uniref:Unplaced genomic scaffold SPHSTscaffold_109, whole genome shotgun sequence n=1 Tax=Sphaerobolus stellatus (strain SS14) TaxID=990650 RepID=A0A0C9UM36_SPHS4|nr:hypothetical protein M422DRAFT_261844 [Sphaerobolus stellatus SS14]